MTRSILQFFGPMARSTSGRDDRRRRVRRTPAIDGLEPRLLLTAAAHTPAAVGHSVIAASADTHYRITLVNDTNVSIRVTPTGYAAHTLAPGAAYPYDAYSFAVRLENLKNHRTYGPRGLTHTTYHIYLDRSGAPYIP